MNCTTDKNDEPDQNNENVPECLRDFADELKTLSPWTPSVIVLRPATEFAFDYDRRAKRDWTRRILVGSVAACFAVLCLVLEFGPCFQSEKPQVIAVSSTPAADAEPINYSAFEGAWSARQSTNPSADYPAKPADEWTDLLKNRYEGWTGADGIFTANLDGTINEGLENRPEQKTVFVFSDTLIGKIDRKKNLRSDVKMVNHSFAILDGNKPQGDRIEFFYANDGKTPRLPIKPSTEGQWYWLSECFVLKTEKGSMLNTFLLRIARREAPGAFGFRHVGVDLLQIPIRDGKLDFEAAIVTEDTNNRLFNVVEREIGDDPRSRSTFFFGTGLLENLKSSGAPNPDGYIYVYGYRDERSKPRRLIVAKVLPEDIARLDRWTYYAGKNGWSNNVQEAVGIADGVSTELSVTPIPFGPKAGKYALIYTPGTIGSKIAVRIGDTPVGPFGGERIIYEESVAATLGEKVFAYNAKAHPVLSTTDELLISYNLNSNDEHFALFRIPDIYFPRFVKIRVEDL